MTLRDGAGVAVDLSFSELLSGTALVALVPATAEVDRAAAMAWQLARAAANAGRKVALVDCHVDEPRLHAVAGEPNNEGIVDVFEYGASLSRIARQQPEENLYFLPAGTFAADPAALMGHQRWRRLAAGFRHEGAVMLLFLPAALVGAIAPNLDGLVALAPGAADAGPASAPEIQAAVDRGVPLLATLSDQEWPEAAAVATLAPAAQPAVGAPAQRPVAPPTQRSVEAPAQRPVAPPAQRPVEAPVQRPSRPIAARAEPAPTVSERASQPYFHRPRPPVVRAAHARWGLYGPLLLLVAAAAAANYRTELGLGDLGLSRLGLASGRDRAAAPAVASGPSPLERHAVDSLPFAVQVSSWTGLGPALDAADALEGSGFLPIVSPLRLGAQLWYRVYVGPVATQDGADSLLSAVRAAGFDRPLAAIPVLVPLSVALERAPTPGAARAERARLRGAGIPAFVLGLADGSYELFAGAFQRPDQASVLDSLLTSSGRAGQLGPRVGFRP
jgi:hypothetical protein